MFCSPQTRSGKGGCRGHFAFDDYRETAVQVPSDPVFKARQDSLDSTGKSGFFQLAPEATMKLSKASAVVAQHARQQVVLILDSRVVQRVMVLGC